jgi:DNA-binding transcriptional MerR regulator
MTKDEAAKLLSVSRRAIERYVNTGKLEVSYVRGKRGKVADYSEHDVLQLKKEIEGNRAIPVVPIEAKLLLTIEEAAAISGLATTDIEEAIGKGGLKRIKGKIRKGDLEKFISSLSS